jgi:hypothetical protein
MAVCCQSLTLGALSSRSALSMLVGALFKKSDLFLNTHYIYITYPRATDLRTGQTVPLCLCLCPYQRPKREMQFEFLVKKNLQINFEFTNIMKELDASIATLKMSAVILSETSEYF